MPKLFGEIPGVQEGDHFKDRKALAAAGVHAPLQGGIDGNSTEGASSIVLSGGYIDDYDSGNEILYTGHGGNDADSGRQVRNQSWDTYGNKGLLISEMHGLPVRVVRGHRHDSPWSPKSGYTYAGLYAVIEHFEEHGRDGYLICRFRMQQIVPSKPLLLPNEIILPEGQSSPQRAPTTTIRIIRDTKLSQAIKKLYNYTCQVCSLRISVKGVGYAEAAHIRPLGLPHNGADQSENLLCLCPNHHVMFDKGVFLINEDLSLQGIDGKLTVHHQHGISKDNLAYHREIFQSLTTVTSALE